MPKSLVIVESPRKAKKIKSFLGNSYDVIASCGHVYDLPQKKIGIDTKHDFKATYEVIPGKSNIVKLIKQKSKNANEIILMGDPDREGHAISINIAKQLLDKKKCYRAASHSITKKAILEAIENKVELNEDDLYHAYEARRILDRCVGFKCSFPVKQATGGPSAGRVQSATLRFLAEREKEIKAFVPIIYWEITAELLTKGKKKVIAALIKPKKLEVNSKEMAEQIIKTLEKGPIKVSLYEKNEKTTRPYAPFTTSTLQQCASSFLGWSPKKTMTVAQDLFNSGKISYHRTDSKFIVSEVVNEIRESIASDYGVKYRPSKQWHYAKSKNAQEAHEACRPTSIMIKEAGDGDERKLYRMIWKRTVASQMAEAKFLKSKAEFTCKKYVLSANGSTCTFDGWRKCWDYGALEDYVVPEMKVGDVVDLIDSTMKKEQTKPPSRYSEASCVKNMEKLGIGRPSTFANTLDTLKSRGYTEVKKKSINVTDLGVKVIDFLVDVNFCFVDLKFTANMEEDLDKIARAEKDKLCVLHDFYETLKGDLLRAKKVKEKNSKTDYKCPKCDGMLLLKFSKFGKFYSCENYNNKDKKCKYIANVGENGCPIEKKKKVVVLSDFDCPKCGAKMAVRDGKYGKFLGCSAFPKCRQLMTMDGEVIEPKKKKKWSKKKDD